jgi:hypothetical protein
VTVILSGQRSDGTPLVLVRCACGVQYWASHALLAHWVRIKRRCGVCGTPDLIPARQPTLAQATAPREAVA